jgi:hypothetical protein
MSVHLVTYATPRFRHRQLLLGKSARLNHVADTATAWTSRELIRAGFAERCPNISLTERGSGFWAWKPFIIDAKLKEVPDGDIVFYCDIGRTYPYKLLEHPIDLFVDWMDYNEQDIMPGVFAPWDGSIGNWTKRSALKAFGLDQQKIHQLPPVQASFSVWRASKHSREFCKVWLEACSHRDLISDDPGTDNVQEHPSFRAHRHDQALLTLCCLKEGLKAFDIGCQKPSFDAKNPTAIISCRLCPKNGIHFSGKLIRQTAHLCEFFERILRKFLSFSKTIHE